MNYKFDLFKNNYLMLYKKYVSPVIVDVFDIAMAYKRNLNDDFKQDLSDISDTLILLEKAMAKEDLLCLNAALSRICVFSNGVSNSLRAISDDIDTLFDKSTQKINKLNLEEEQQYQKEEMYQKTSFEHLKEMFVEIINNYSKGFVVTENLKMNYEINWDDRLNKLLSDFNQEVIFLDSMENGELTSNYVECLQRIQHIASESSDFFEFIWDDSVYLLNIPTWPEFPEDYRIPECYHYPHL